MTIIKNFTGLQELHVNSTISEDIRIGPLVNLSTYAGAMTMHFSMTPDQARHLVQTLIKSIELLEDAK